MLHCYNNANSDAHGCTVTLPTIELPHFGLYGSYVVFYRRNKYKDHRKML